MNRRVVSTRNKYLVLEEKWDAEGRDGHTSEGGVVESGGPSPRNKSWSSFTDKVSSNDRLKLSMTKVDGFNCAVGPTTPSRGKTVCCPSVQGHNLVPPSTLPASISRCSPHKVGPYLRGTTYE